MKFLKVLFELLYEHLLEKSTKMPGKPDKGMAVKITKEIEETGHSVENAEAVLRARILQSMHEDLGDAYEFGVEVLPDQESDLWDCSEKIEDAFRDAGEYIPDGAQAQFNFCRPVTHIKPCDLGFMWSDKRKCIGHVFMFTDRGTVIHAVAGRGMVEDDADRWVKHERFRGVFRHPVFQRGADRPKGGPSIEVPGLD